MRRFILFLVAGCCFLLSACGVPASSAATDTPIPQPTAAASANPCALPDLQSYRAAYSNIYDRWGVALIAAGRAQPAELKTPIQQLQTISGELSTLKPPICAQQANAETAQAMAQIIEGYQNLMLGKEVGNLLTQGIDLLALAHARVNALPAPLAATPTLKPTVVPPAITPSPTVTPTPTATPTEAPSPTPTEAPRNGVISSKQTQVYATATSDVPIRTIFQGTRVLVIEGQKGRLHIRSGNIEGWVSQGAVVIR